MGSELLNEALSVIWHAGEPLIVPVDVYRKSIDMFRSMLGSYATIKHCFQTNGMLIDDAWCDLFAESRARIGVRIDGPDFVHDAHRRTRSGRGTHAKVMKGVEKLHSRGIPFHVIAVVTREHLVHADAIASFFHEAGIEDVGFNIDEAEGGNESTSMPFDGIQFGAFLRRLSRQAKPLSNLRIRELDNAARAIVVGLGSYRFRGIELPENVQVVPFAITTVDCNGNSSMFSPELLGQLSRQYGNFALGNVAVDRMADVGRNEIFQRLMTEIFAGVFSCKAECEYFVLCGGGAPVNKFYENGAFSSTSTSYCRHMHQVPVDVVLEAMESRVVGR